ncbi:MAG: hypothetical protein QXI33_03605 [Candidatus Pacearchaeota archaeon]
MKKKGQAALEFLMTYGWAILAAIIVVGVLYFLIGNPSTLAGDKFIMAAPFTAGEKSLSQGSGIKIEIINGAGKTIDVDVNDDASNLPDISLTGLSGCSVTGSFDPGSNSDSWAPGTKTIFTFTGCSGATNGNRINTDIQLNYTAGSSLVQYGSGSLSGLVRS